MIFALFILNTTHRRIVAAYNAGHAEAMALLRESGAQTVALLKESHAQTVAMLEAQIAELRRDRNYYREQTLKDSGRPSPQSSTLEKTEPATSTSAHLAADDLFESWGLNDEEREDHMEMFQDWAAEQVGLLGQATDVKKLWRETYGSLDPVTALTV